MTALCDHFSAFYRRTVRVVFALSPPGCLSAIWSFAISLILMSIPGSRQTQRFCRDCFFVWSVCCAFGIRLPAAPRRCCAGYDTLLFSARFFSLPFG